MNPAAVISYAKRGGDKLIGRSLLDCHNPESKDKIQQVVDWFAVDESHNIVYTFTMRNRIRMFIWWHSEMRES